MHHTRILSTAAAVLLVATAAQAQRGQDDRRGRPDQPAQAQRSQDDHNGRQGQRVQVAPQDQRRHDGDDRRRAEQAQNEHRAAETQNQDRAAQDAERERAIDARQREQNEQIERAQRASQEERLEQERRRAELNRVYDRDRDYRPGYDYRYNMGGVYRETNQYGVDELRRAVDLGYQQGYRAGEMDRRDRAPADYRRALDYQNWQNGYAGNYVPQSDYTYYFREGFQRGYDDAYWNRARYGTFYNGNASILSDIVSGILGLTSIR